MREWERFLLFLPDPDFLVRRARGNTFSKEIESQIEYIVIVVQRVGREHGLLLQEGCLLKESLLWRCVLHFL